ncbi:MAG: cupin domain-containing protein [Phenylobacterium sp.]|uniref:cupin domain-containing protein n=1 Tax=Phenylobacterium sp. TaxID=1871053 RepID=UPI002732B153|nr:cupin domain-containing protein [Phenylobacterium sp.]MDP3749536.1 cupin domain-containing protein [Phenylobacterium sp.]
MMKFAHAARAVLGATVIALAPAVTQAAGTVAAQGRHVLPGPGGQLLTAITVSYGPGEKSGPHRHGASAFVYVLEGEIRSQVDNGPAQVFKPGESWFEPAGAHHVVSENASTTRSTRILVVFVGPTDATLSIPDN